MPHGRPDLLLRHLRQAAAPAAAQAPDASLLEQFTHRHDEAAFAVLVQRHGPLVWNVCRRVLSDEQEAEDAFQAAFLVLAQKAGTIRQRQSVGSWLYGVAYRLALRARANAARRQKLAHQAPDRPTSDPLEEVSGRELLRLLDAELQRLPERLRAPLLLCYLEGQSQEEAAAQLGLGKTTFRGRLERARELLRRRLSRRGLALSAALFPAAFVPGVGAAMPKPLAAATAHAAVLVTKGGVAGVVSPSVLALVRGLRRALFFTRLRAAVLLVVLGLLGAWAVVLATHAPADVPPAKPDAAAARAAAPVEPGPPAERPAVDRFGDPLPPGVLARLGTVRLRHGGRVAAVTFAPDGKTAASAAEDAEACLWDVATGRAVRRYRPRWAERMPNLMAHALSLSPDGRILAVGYGNSDSSIQLFDAATARELARLKGHTHTVYAVAFLPDGRLVSGGWDDTLRVWDVATGKELRKLAAGHRDLRCLAASADGKTVATGGDDKTVRVWDLATGQRRHELKGHGGAIAELAFAPDGRTLVSAAYNDRMLRVWDLATGRTARELKGDGPMAFSPDGAVLATGGGLRMILLWQADTGRELRRFAGHKHALTALAFAPDGRTLISGSWDGTVRFWDAATGRERSAARGHEYGIHAVAFAPDGRTVVSGSEDSTVRTWDAQTGAQLRLDDFAEYLPFLKVERAHNGRGVAALAFSPDGRLLAVGGYFIAKLIDPATGKRRGAFPIDPLNPTLSRLAYAPDGKMVAGVARRRVHFWDTVTGKELRRLPDHKGYIRAVAFSPDGKLLATVCADRSGLIRLWDAATGRPVREIKSRTNNALYALAFAPGGALAAGGGDSGRFRDENLIEVWDPATGQLLRTFRGPYSSAGSLAYSPDGKTLAARGGAAVYLWEVATGQARGRFVGHAGPIEALAFAPDGCALVTIGRDSTGLVWDLTAGRRTARPLTDAQWQAAWADLGDADAVKAYRAVWTLAAAPQTVAALRERLRPLTPDEVAKIVRWVADLDSKRFPTREQAGAALEKLGHRAEPALRRAAAENPPLEVRRRLEQLLKKLAAPSAERLRELRALEALGHVATPAARALLEALAAGDPLDRLTPDARTVLALRAKRAGPP